MDESSDQESGVPEEKTPTSGSDAMESAPTEDQPAVSTDTSIDDLFPQAAEGTAPARNSIEERKAALARTIQNEVVQGGRIESQSDYQSVIVFGKPVNHILHLILTVVTCGIWGVVWLGMLIWGGESRVMVSIDDYGNVLRQKLK